jgi:hypothetical protein
MIQASHLPVTAPTYHALSILHVMSCNAIASSDLSTSAAIFVLSLNARVWMGSGFSGKYKVDVGDSRSSPAIGKMPALIDFDHTPCHALSTSRHRGS